jgi:ADP-ribose pyrophosphatase YjhB (NUDIX family)
MDQKIIPQQEYDRIVELMPICCVDILPAYQGSILLSKRTNAPGKGEWFPVGGRVYKKEPLVETAQRKTKEELGVDAPLQAFERIGVEESIFNGTTTDENRHSVNVLYLLQLPEMPSLAADATQLAEVAWFAKVDHSWHPYVQRAVEAAFNKLNHGTHQ